MSEIAYIDFSYARPNPQAVKNAGYSGVIGYISHTGSKCLSNWRDYVATGLNVVFVFEDAASRAREGANAGADDGQFVEQWLRGNGVPEEAAVFFAVDYQIPGTDEACVGEYGAAFNAATNNPVGIYGDYDVVETHVTPGVQPMQFGWQTVAWSGDSLSSKAHLYQRNTHHWPNPAGSSLSDYDEDVLCLPLPVVGGDAPAPTPPPPPAPRPSGPQYVIVESGDNLVSIAKRYWQPWITAQSIAQLNGLPDPDYIQVGQQLRIY